MLDFPEAIIIYLKYRKPVEHFLIKVIGYYMQHPQRSPFPNATSNY